MLNAVSMAEYRPPEQGYGSKTVAHLNELISSLNLSGIPAGKTAKEIAASAIGVNKRTPGFTLCLELMSSKLDLRVLESDKPHTLGALLLRMLPDFETLSKGVLISILRVCASNSGTAGTLPSFWMRWDDAKRSAADNAKKGGLLGRITGMISDGFDATKFNMDFIKTVCTRLQKDKSHLVLPPVSRIFSFSPDASFTLPAHNARLHQGLWSLQIGDAKCASRSYNGNETLLTQEVMPSLMMFLQPSDDSQIDVSHLATPFHQRFPIAAHASAKTANATAVLKRLAGDTDLYKNGVIAHNKARALALKGLGRDSIRAAVENKGAELDKMVTDMMQLQVAVLKVQQRDLEDAAHALDAAIALADNPLLGGVPDLASGVLPLRHALAQAGGQTLTVSLHILVCMTYNICISSAGPRNAHLTTPSLLCTLVLLLGLF